MLTGLGDTAQIHLYFGRAYREGEWEALGNAVQEFHKALVKDAKLPQAHYFLALTYLVRDGEAGFPEAIPELQEELKLSPQDYRSHYLLGYIAMKKHEPKTAETELLRAAALEPQNPDPLVFLGQLYSDSGRSTEAEAATRKAIVLTKDASRNDYQINRAHYVLARLLLAAGRSEEGKRELEISKDLRDRVMHPELSRNQKSYEYARLLQEGPAGHTTVTTVALSSKQQKNIQIFIEQLKPTLGEAYNNLGVIFAGRKDFSTALDFFRKAADWNPKLETIDRNWGMAEFYAGQFDQAVAPLERHLQTHSDDLRVRAALGLSYFTLSNYHKALEVLRPIEAQVNDDPGLSYAFAVSLVKTGDYTNGVARLRAIEQANPNSAEVHTLLGEAFADQTEFGTALEEYRKALAIDPQRAETHYMAGIALIHQGDPSDAAQELRAALKLNPNYVASKYHLAFALIQMQQKDEAASLLNEVIREDPKYVDAYYELGKMQMERGDTKAAITNFETGIKLNPDSDHIHYQLAMAYRRESRMEDADRELRMYQTLKNQRRGRGGPQTN
jgi:tetratricopeptide (TPR) repeat protein